MIEPYEWLASVVSFEGDRCVVKEFDFSFCFNQIDRIEQGNGIIFVLSFVLRFNHQVFEGQFFGFISSENIGTFGQFAFIK